ncbi:hypothetical protein [Helicobacter brantae]|uniref:Uncharacterized protein n=1 Tax=Helicobacter brantae TaxID=375927 RepID=A0A3D8J1Q2_9HELI|nr:hypothetical protein [Helicobacter brantae]RDU71418.1 hypothetical protein CQA58_02405 [Helicobacter brantae]
MQSKTLWLSFIGVLLVCILGACFVVAFLPRLFGVAYILKVETPQTLKTPFGGYILFTPSLNGTQTDVNALPCQEFFAQLVGDEGGHILSGDFSCTPPSSSYIKGVKTPYGISFKIKDTYLPYPKIQEVRKSQKLMAKVWIYEGVGSVEEIIF